MNAERLPVQETLDELEAQAVSEQDLATLEAWKAEIAAERAEAEGSMAPAPELHQNLDGSVVTAEEHQEAVANGENPSGPYGSGTRA